MSRSAAGAPPAAPPAGGPRPGGGGGVGGGAAAAAAQPLALTEWPEAEAVDFWDRGGADGGMGSHSTVVHPC
jgi:hypothetical protein